MDKYIELTFDTEKLSNYEKHLLSEKYNTFPTASVEDITFIDFRKIDRAALDADTWCDLLLRRPDLKDYCDWSVLEIEHWYRLIIRDANYYQWCVCIKELDGDQWARILSIHPHLFAICDLRLLSDMNWVTVLNMQPQFSKYCDWDKFSVTSKRVLARLRSEFRYLIDEPRKAITYR